MTVGWEQPGAGHGYGPAGKHRSRWRVQTGSQVRARGRSACGGSLPSRGPWGEPCGRLRASPQARGSRPGPASVDSTVRGGPERAEHWAGSGMRTSRQADLFTVLGLPAAPGLTDDEVRAAWRRIASATHPDRADGGDPARFAAAAAAYTALRTQFGRAETLAEDRAPEARHGPGGAVAGRWWSRAR